MSSTSENSVELESQKLSCGYYFTSKNKQNAWGIQIGAIHREMSFDPGNYYWMYSASLPWDLKFR